MAVTINSQPSSSTIHPAYRYLIYDVSSDDATIKRMKAAITIDSVLVTGDNPVTQDPDLASTSDFTFDIQTFVQDNLTFDLNHNVVAVTDCPGSKAQVNVTFTELLENISGQLVDGLGAAATGIDTIQATRQHEDTQTLAEFELGSATQKFLTNGPQSKRIGSDENEVLGVLVVTAGGFPRKVRVLTYDANDALIQTAEIGANTIDSNERSDVPAGTKNLNAATLVTGAQPVIDSTVVRYEVLIVRTSDGSAQSETKEYRIDRGCDNDAVRFHWLNRLGGFDSFTFYGRKIEGQDVDSDTYQKYLANGFAVSDRGREELGPIAADLFEVEIGPQVSIITQQWLKEVYSSPQVFIENSSNQLVPIIVDKRMRSIDFFDATRPQSIKFRMANDTEIQRN